VQGKPTTALEVETVMVPVPVTLLPLKVNSLESVAEAVIGVPAESVPALKVSENARLATQAAVIVPA